MDKTSHIPDLRYSEWCNLESRLLWAYEGHPLGARGTFNPWKHSAWLLTRGALRIRGASRDVEALAGSWVFPPFATDTREFSEDASILSISFWLRWPDGRGLFELPDARVLAADACPQLEKNARRLLRQLQHSPLSASVDLQTQNLNVAVYLNLQRLFQGWITSYIEAMTLLDVPAVTFSQTDERMLAVQLLLDLHPLSKPLNVAQIAAKIHLSLSHTDRLFRSEFGLSVKAYFEARRLSAAQHDLSQTQLSVKEIAYSVGFKDASSFSHWFAKNQGCYPREFRARVTAN